MTFEVEFSGGFWYVQILDLDICGLFASTSTFSQFFLQTLNLIFQIINFFLQTQNRLPFNFQFITFWINTIKVKFSLISKSLRSFRELIIN